MSNSNFTKFSDGVVVVPKTSSTVDGEGGVDYDTTNHKFNAHNGTTASPVVTEAHSATLTNKTIDASSNTLSNITNTEIKSNAAIAYSKLASLTSAHILVGSAGNVATDVAMSGDVSITNGGVTAVGAVGGSTAANVHAAELLANAAIDANTASTIVKRDGSGNFSAGTITATLSGNATNVSGTVAIGNGGTGQTTKSAGFDALSPMSASGDIIYGGTSGTGTRLAKGTDGQILTLSSGLPIWQANGSSLVDVNDLLNFSITTSVSANAMTIALKDAAGSDPSSGSPVKIAFRNATLTTGSYSLVSATAATSITVTSGATLGHQDAVNQNIYVWAINNAGTIELAVSGSRNFDELTVQTTTAIDASADDWATLYSTSARSNKAIRLLARIVSNQTTAGTYASNAVEICGVSKLPPEITQWKSDLTFTASAGFGTVSNQSVWYRQVADTMEVRGYWKYGTAAGTEANISLPSNYTIDSSKFASTTSVQTLGEFSAIRTSTTLKVYSEDRAGKLFYDGSTTNKVYFGFASASDIFTKAVATNFGTTSDGLEFRFTIAIARFRSY